MNASTNTAASTDAADMDAASPLVSRVPEGAPAWYDRLPLVDEPALLPAGDRFLWLPGSSSTTERISHTPSGRKVRLVDVEPHLDEAAVLAVSRSAAAMRCLAAILAFGHLTAEQVAAHAGRRLEAAQEHLDALVDAGIVVAGLPLPTEKPLSVDSPRVFAANVGHPAVDHLQKALPTELWRSVTGGEAPTKGHHHVRHDLTTAEIVLRIAEVHAVGLVAGETAHQRLWPGLDRYSRFDAVLVRPDGARIAIETTLSTSRSLVGKLAKALVALHGHGYAANLAMAFILGPNVSPTSFGDRLDEAAERSGLRRIDAAKAKQRLFWATLSSDACWFANDGGITRDFARLRAFRRNEKSDVAEAVDLVDLDLGCRGGIPWAESTRARKSFWATPRWIAEPLRRAG